MTDNDLREKYIAEGNSFMGKLFKSQDSKIFRATHFYLKHGAVPSVVVGMTPEIGRGYRRYVTPQYLKGQWEEIEELPEA